jgi:putative glycosyltransferase (TIGR04372 family)
VAYGRRPPVLRLTEEHRIRGIICRRMLGLPDDAWYVAVHCRERGYVPTEPIHNFRDVSVENYFPAMNAIVERGGWCVRMGDPSMKPLPPMKNVIDYALHPLRSDWMDVFLCATCKFVLASSSGLCNVANVFGVPSAVANHAPLSVVYGLGAFDLGIPKFFWSNPEDRCLTFPELLNSPAGNFRYQYLYDEADIRVEENNPDDIRALALEMNDIVEGKAVYTEEDERLQSQFRSLFRDGHYTYGAGGRIGRDFLRKYQAMLSPVPAAS